VVFALLSASAFASNAGTVGKRPAFRAERPAANRALTTPARIARAQRFARRRAGVVAFTVLEKNARPRGLRRTVRFRSASVVKAMLMVAVLRRAGRRRVTNVRRRHLRRMITVSDNDAANALYAEVGGRGLRKVARAAGMRKFVDVGHWAEAWITAADQARLFLQIDRLVPRAHRRYGRKLLSSVVSWQRWGIARVARRRHMKVFFKGGWRTGILHQAALLERNGRRVALAVLTSGSPSETYARETMERIAVRVLRPRHG
jgi:Beta-lactamase enzyme family